MSCDLTALANKGVQALHPYSPGKPISELERELGISNIVKLASNENPLPLPARVLEAIQGELAELARYPDSNGFYLKEALANKMGVDMGQITLGNGSNDVLEMLARVFLNEHSNAVFSAHAFVVYPIVTQAVGAKSHVVPAKNWGHDLTAMAEAIDENTKMVFIANPNNPTGTWVEQAELKAFLANVPEHVIVVIDEAYNEYTGQVVDTHTWIKQHPNLVVTRTFSKAYGLAGLRVGYALSDEKVAGLLNRIRQPFNNNNLALAAATAVLDDTAFLEKAIQVNRDGMQQLLACFESLGLESIPSKGNFITVNMAKDAAPIYQALLHKGVIVRPVANYGMPEHLRISIGLAEENQKLIDVLPSCLA